MSLLLLLKCSAAQLCDVGMLKYCYMVCIFWQWCWSYTGPSIKHWMLCIVFIHH